MSIKFILVALVWICLSHGAWAKQLASQQRPDSSLYHFTVDVTSNVPLPTLRCIKEQGFAALFIQIYSPINGGTPNFNGIQTMPTAQSAGIGFEMYVTPATSGKSIVVQFTEAMNAPGMVKPSTIWLQVTSPADWSTNRADNIALIQTFEAQAIANKMVPGIFTNINDWAQITGNFVDPTSSSLWYSNVYGNGPTGQSPPNFDDFQPFGRWMSPNAKQFAQNVDVCGITVNKSAFQPIPTQKKV